MKIKANKKFNNVDPQAIPCSVADRKALKKGQSVDYLCEPRTKPEVYAAIEKIALIQLQIKNCDDIIYTANIPEFDDPLF